MRKLERKQNKRAPYDRILIVCEGSKTEPNYFKEIKSQYRLHPANVQIHPSKGTSPLQVVEYAEKIFKEGDLGNRITKRAFDQIYAVFDRDEHQTYLDALTKADSLCREIKNDDNKLIPFYAIPSNPCFEFWLLLHFKDVKALFHRNEVMKKLKIHYPDYKKNAQGVWEHTKNNLDLASERATKLMTLSSLYNDAEPNTAISDLVRTLTTLKN